MNRNYDSDSELCGLKRTRTSVKGSLTDMKTENFLNFIKIICTDLLCWIFFVPLCSGSGDEALSLYKCQQAEKIKPIFFR